MISKFGKIQNSWCMKAILALTALSFMSLFGISGYISGKKNKPVIKVDDVAVYQNEISQKMHEALALRKRYFGEDDNPDEKMQKSIMEGIVKTYLENAIVDRTAEVYNVYISDDLIRKIIFSQPEFMDETGRFDRNRFVKILSMINMSEAEYVNNIKREIKKQHLVNDLVRNVNAPKVMVKYLAKAENARRIFKYIKINAKNLQPDRKMSKEEIEQYYQDFAVNFSEPERRSADFIYVSNAQIEKNIKISNQEAAEYMEANKSQFETPETRAVLQIILPTAEEADKAFKELQQGKDFYAVAAETAKQDKAQTDLGKVSKDMLIPELADAVFSAKNGEVIRPLNSELGWHIVKVAGIEPAKKMNPETVKNQVAEILKKEKSFDAAYEFSKEVDDKIGHGESLAKVAKDMGLRLNKVTDLDESGKALHISAYPELLANKDFADSLFLYNVGEVSQIAEADDGFFVVEVTNIKASQPKPIAEVKGEIEKIWAENERAAIAQEIVNDVMHDLESGDDVAEVASRFNLPLAATGVINRKSSFEGIDNEDMVDLFQNSLNEARLIHVNGTQLVVVPVQEINGAANASEQELSAVREVLETEVLPREFADALLKAYAKDYDVRVKYRLLGMVE